MSKTTYISARVTPSLKEASDSVLAKIGLTTSDYINIMLNQLVINQGIPFPIQAYPYNQETVEAMHEARAQKQTLKAYETTDEMLNDLWK